MALTLIKLAAKTKRLRLHICFITFCLNIVFKKIKKEMPFGISLEN
jgi:hypothetical protein